MPSFAQLVRRVEEELGQRDRYAHSVRVARCADLLAHGMAPIRERHGWQDCFTISPGSIRPSGSLPNAKPVVFRSKSPSAGIQCSCTRSSCRDCERPIWGSRIRTCYRQSRSTRPPRARCPPLDCIVYLADSLEPNRSFPERADLWRLALDDLAGAMRAVLLLTMRHKCPQRRCNRFRQRWRRLRALG